MACIFKYVYCLFKCEAHVARLAAQLRQGLTHEAHELARQAALSPLANIAASKFVAAPDGVEGDGGVVKDRGGPKEGDASELMDESSTGGEGGGGGGGGGGLEVGGMYPSSNSGEQCNSGEYWHELASEDRCHWQALGACAGLCWSVRVMGILCLVSLVGFVLLRQQEEQGGGGAVAAPPPPPPRPCVFVWLCRAQLGGGGGRRGVVEDERLSWQAAAGVTL